MIRILIAIILIVIILSLLGINVASLVNNKTLRENSAAVWSWTKTIWSNYLQEPTKQISIFIWEKGIKPLLELVINLNKVSTEAPE